MGSSSSLEVSTHDLWIAARKFAIDISRVSPTSIKLTITKPLDVEPKNIIDGAVLLLGTKPLNVTNYPNDGTQYSSADTVYGNPSANTIGNFQVVGFYSDILSHPWPAGSVSSDGNSYVFEVTITGTDTNTLYYASIHACTNVLQYYPIGIQSYALEASRIESDSSTYAGSIPSLPGAPTSPAPGTVYFDTQLNLVQYWDAVRGVWIPTRADSIISGNQNPGIVGHAYMLSGNRLRIFNGKQWVDGTPANIQFRVPSGWIPLGNVSSNVAAPVSPNAGDLYYDFTTQRIQYWDGTQWQIPTPNSSLLQINSGTIVPAFTVSFTYEGTDMVTPYVGLLFYNTRERSLKVFNGSTWQNVNTEYQGTSISDKIGIGNDGSYDERLRLINILKAQLGYPALCVELSEEQFNIAIDNALDIYRQLSVGAYERRFFVFQLNANQVVYHLNNPGDRTDAIVTVMKVHRTNLYGVTGSGLDNTWSQAWAQQWNNLNGGAGDLLSVHLVHAWSEEYQRIFAGDIPFTWNEARRELFLHRIIRTPEKVVLEVELERSEQELFLDRWCKQFLQNWALAECKQYLGMIRSKYSSGTPGPAGTITLNGDTLLNEARQDFTELKQSLLDLEYQNAEHGIVSFSMG
jgi:hypothetical protein